MTRIILSFILLFGVYCPGSAMSQIQEPGGTPSDAVAALRDSDEYAWRLFFFVNHQAEAGAAGVADPAMASIREYDDDSGVVWETWALASGLDLDFSTGSPPFPILGNVSEVFKNPATKPVEWDKLDREEGKPKLLAPDFKSTILVASSLDPMFLLGESHGRFNLMIAPPGSDPAQDETRMNRSTYDTIRDNTLYSVEGIEAAAEKAQDQGDIGFVEFEPESKEVKARWIHLRDCNANSECEDKKRYHWRTVTGDDGSEEVWGLATLHIITKDLPNWLWTDFGHIDCETGTGACEGFKAETPLRDSTTVNTGGVRPETEGTKWEFYRLRGSQIDFVTPSGIDSVLSNPVIEETFQTSSCITCHSYASSASEPGVVNQGTSLPILAGKKGVRNVGSKSFDIGRPTCQRFFTPGGNPPYDECANFFDTEVPLYFQSDFLWSIPFRAFSETEN